MALTVEIGRKALSVTLEAGAQQLVDEIAPAFYCQVICPRSISS